MWIQSYLALTFIAFEEYNYTALNVIINTTQEVSFSDDFGGYIE